MNYDDADSETTLEIEPLVMLEETDRKLSRGRLPEAFSALESASGSDERFAGDFSVMFRLAELSLHQLEAEKAWRYSQLAARLKPESPDAVYLQALAARALGDARKAMFLCHRCQSMAPEHRGCKDLALLLAGKKCRPSTERKKRRLRSFPLPASVSVFSPSDRETDLEMRRMWGDYWVKKELIGAFADLDIHENGKNPDIAIHLFGFPPRKSLPANTMNVVWLYSHPDMVTLCNLRDFDIIFVASKTFEKKLRIMGYLNVETMPACTAKSLVSVPHRHDMIFLGNARRSRTDGRKIVADMQAAGLGFKVWGNRWEEILPEKFIGGSYWPYERLAELYAEAKITLNDHHPDMAREGFVSNKVFDILASGGFVISGKNAGLKGLFGDAVPEYDTPEDLKGLAKFFLNHPEKRRALREKGRKLAMGHTYAACAARMAS